jgi:hypothetical protein
MINQNSETRKHASNMEWNGSINHGSSKTKTFKQQTLLFSAFQVRRNKTLAHLLHQVPEGISKFDQSA